VLLALQWVVERAAARSTPRVIFFRKLPIADGHAGLRAVMR
jgi:hypothetical protein